MRILGAAVLAALAIGCGGDDVVCGEAVPVTAVSYNVADQIGTANGDNIVGQLAAISADFIGLQECQGCSLLVDQLPEGYQLTATPRAGVAIVYDSSRWQSQDQGVFPVGDNDDGWGERVVMWARFSNLASGHCLYFYTTHWCVTVRNPDDVCDEERQLDYAAATLDHIGAREIGQAPVILGGDLNVFDGFEDGLVINYLGDSGLVDLYRVIDPVGDATTFVGNDWAPAGRLDYLFSTAPVEVLGAFIDRESIPAGEGSDHYPVTASVEFE
jgi:endonuclease/exonuclease/phosphatase family metal-dependent hydrolase